MATNLINVFVFLNPILKEKSYKYMLSSCISNLCYTTMLTVWWIFIVSKQPNTSYFVAFYEIAIFDYLTSSLAIFRILIEITLTLQTYCILDNNKCFDLVSYKLVIFILFLISLVFYLPVCFYKNITVTTDATAGRQIYAASVNSFGESATAHTLIIILQSVRLCLVNVVLTVVNLFTFLKFRFRYLNHRIGMVNHENNSLTFNNQGQSRSLYALFYDCF
jgi:hypothetical protein